MAISSAFALIGPAQKDGRQYVRETHSDAQGVVAVIEYLSAVGANYSAILTARAAQLAVSLAVQEAIDKVANDVNPTPFRFQTAAEFAQRLRAYYKDATQLECARVATWIMNRLDDGSVTDAQLQNVWSLTAQQYATLKAKWSTLRTQYNAIQAAEGE